MGDSSRKPAKAPDERDLLGQINSAVYINAGKGGIQSAMGIQDAYEQILANGQPLRHNRNPEGVLPICQACKHKNRIGAEHCGQCGKAL
jgi:hypothetical protein